MIALFAFPFLVSTVVTNLALVPWSISESQPPTIQPLEGGSVIVQPGVAGSPSLFELLGFAVAALIGSAAVFARLLRRQRRRGDEYFFVIEQQRGNPVVLAVLLAIVPFLLYGLISLLKAGPEFSAWFGGIAVSPAVFLYLSEVAMLTAIIGVVFFVSTKVPRAREIASVPVTRQERTELEAALNQMAYAFRYTGDYRSVILDTYRTICRILNRKGNVDSSGLTAREFEALIAERLKVPKEYLHQATFLFEKARYSLEPISREDVLAAQLCLEKLQEQNVPSRESRGAV